MSESVLIVPSADGGEPEVRSTSLGDHAAEYAAHIQAKQQQPGLNIADGAAPPVPEGATESQLQRLQMHPVYKMRTPEGNAFRAAVAAGYMALGRPNTPRPGEVTKAVEGRVEQAPEGQAEADADNAALREMALSQEDADVWNAAANDIEADLGEGAYDYLVDTVVTEGDLSEEDIQALAEAGYDYDEVKAAGVYVGGAILTSLAASEGYTSEGLLAFSDSLSAEDSKALAKAILTGNNDVVTTALRQFKARSS